MPRRPGAHLQPGRLELRRNVGRESRLEMYEPVRRVEPRPGDGLLRLEPLVEDSSQHLDEGTP